MRALSLKQPFAELVVSGKKTIELRKWNTNFRGKFLVHASKTPDKRYMEKFGFTNLPMGCIVGKANLVNVKKYNSEEEFNLDKNLHLATKEWGRYGFVLGEVQKMNPIPAKGSLGFWELDK